MPTWQSIAWFPICAGLTAVGLVLSWLTWRRAGARRGLRAAAWSLLPIAVYLAGAVVLIGRIGAAVVQFAGSFVFSPRAWAGVSLLGLAVLIFLSTGGLPMLRGRRGRASRKTLARGQADAKAPVTAGAVRPARAAVAPEDDLADVAEILRRRGIK